MLLIFRVFLITFIEIFNVPFLDAAVHRFYEIFRDDFNSSDVLNASCWNTAEGPGINKELQYYLTNNTYVEDGTLRLLAEDRQYGGKNYISGRVDTRGYSTILYGEVEWRAKFPKGAGLWSSLALIPAQCKPFLACPEWPPSISMIDVCGDQTNKIFTTVHYKEPGSNIDKMKQDEFRRLLDMSLDFHVYKLVWLPTEISWYINGTLVFKVLEKYMIPSIPLQLIIPLAISGDYLCVPNKDSKFPAEFIIDYVVVRQLCNDTIEIIQDSKIILPLLISLGISLVAVMFAVSFCYIRKRKMITKQGLLPSKKLTIGSQKNVCDLPLASNWGNVYRTLCYNADINPYFRFLEIPPQLLQKTSDLLGKGQFGLVWKGYLKGEEKHEDKTVTVVALKTFLDCGDIVEEEQQRHLFMEEMKIMIKVGRHLNIVNLLGTFTTGKPILMVIEFCCNGSLLKYLREQRAKYVSSVDENGVVAVGGHNGNGPSEPKHDEQYLSKKFLPRQLPTHDISNITKLTTDDLINISYQVARGLEYLANQSIIHRDLAARNVLVCEKNIVKISDFGMARERIMSDYILQNEQAALPVKWMAPESITNKTYSYASDVWSFGILMWEIFTLGDSPFSPTDGFPANIRELIRVIIRGRKMTRPADAPVFMYELMLMCWNMDKDRRPSASVLRHELSFHMPVDPTHLYEELDEPYQKYNLIHAELLEAISTTEIPLPDSTDSDLEKDNVVSPN